MKIGDRVQLGEHGTRQGTVVKHPREQPRPPVWAVRVQWDDGEIKVYRYGECDLWYASGGKPAREQERNWAAIAEQHHYGMRN